MAILLNALKERNVSFDPSGYNPSPVAASKTRAGEIPNYSTEVQLEKAASAVGKNNTKAQNLENENNGMVGGVLPVTGIGTDEPLRFGNQVDIGDVANQVINEKVADSKRAPSVPTATSTEVDIQKLTDKLRADQEAERAKFERKRMADRISRMGFALGNLIGAKGGTTDASAITLDDGTKQVGEYRKDMEDINKQNMDAYQRALEQIYRKEDQDYKNAVFKDKQEQTKIDNERKDKVAEAQIEASKALATQRNATADANTIKAQAYVEELASRLEKNKKYGDAAMARAAASALRAGAYAEYTRLMGELKANGAIQIEEVTDESGNKKVKKVTKTPNSSSSGGKKTAYGKNGKKPY